MRPIAYLTGSGRLADGRDDPELRREHLVQLEALAGPCAARGFELVTQVWSDASVDWSAYDAAVIATTWDYADRRDAFLDALRRIDAAAPVLNSPATVAWNIDKRYLRALDAAGAPTVPTIWAARADPLAIDAAFAALQTDELVVKPQVGAGAWRQARLRRGEALPEPAALPPAACMIQPYLPTIATWGEASLLYFGGVYSHAVLKTPQTGDYRVQSSYGARERDHAPTPAERTAAEAALAAAQAESGERFLYARVDLVRDARDAPLLMELELIEPYYYPDQGPACGEAFAAALAARLA